MSAEEWRPIPGYSRYEASSEGRIRKTVDSTMPNWCAPSKFRGKMKGEMLEAVPNGRGHPYVGVLPDGFDFRAINPKPPVRVSKLVALAFLGPQPDGCEVGHRDMDPANCRADNIVYRTRNERLAEMAAVGRGPGRKPGRRNLTCEEVDAIRTRRKSGEPVASIARDYPDWCTETIRRASINYLGPTWMGKRPHRALR